MLESSLERSCCAWASKELAVKNLKLVSMVGIPDRLFMYRGAVLFIELKAPGQQARTIQKYIHQTLQNNGFRVEVVDNAAQSKKLMMEWVYV